MAVADAWSAMTMRRAHGTPRSHETACARIAAVAGRDFDPRVVEAFLSLPAGVFAPLEGEPERAVPSEG